ncbi:hypothetical protein EON83_26095 [bacterium]|nr:MAG: hypothetical protein EON83_26095 [bacterium]
MAPRPALHAHKLAFSPDGKLVVALGVPVKVPIDTPYKYKIEKKGAQVWTVADGKIYRSYPWSDAKQLAFSPDSQYLALPSQGNIKIIHLPTNQVQATLDTPNKPKKFYFSPDGKWFLMEGEWQRGEQDKENGLLFTQYYNLNIWHLGDNYNHITKTQQRVVGIPKVRYVVEYSPDKPPMIRYNPVGPIYWCQDTERGQWQQATDSDDGKWQAFVYKAPNNTVQIWDATKRTIKSTFPVPNDLQKRTMYPMGFSRSNRWFCSLPVFWEEYYQRKTYFWDINQGKMTDLKPDLGTDNTSTVMQVVRRLEGYAETDVTPTLALSLDENLIAFTYGVAPDTDSAPILTVYDLNTGQRLPAIFK